MKSDTTKLGLIILFWCLMMMAMIFVFATSGCTSYNRLSKWHPSTPLTIEVVAPEKVEKKYPDEKIGTIHYSGNYYETDINQKR